MSRMFQESGICQNEFASTQSPGDLRGVDKCPSVSMVYRKWWKYEAGVGSIGFAEDAGYSALSP